MPPFTSRRERNLWIIAAIVVIAIFTTLGLSGKLYGLFTNQRLVEQSIFAGFIIILVSIAALNMQVRPSGIEIGAALGVAAVTLMAFLRITAPAERTHLIEYSIVGMLIFHALKERAANGGKVTPNPAVLALGITFSLGLLDESIQGIIPGRIFSFVDLLFNLFAAVIGVFGSLIIGLARRWSKRFSRR
ncbi:MAG: VanZ family protein [Chloroflexota bacterium]